MMLHDIYDVHALIVFLIAAQLYRQNYLTDTIIIS